MRLLFVQAFPQSPTVKTIGFRLIADDLPIDASKHQVSLSMSPGGCMTSITALWEHDNHAQGMTNAQAEVYTSRVAADVQTALEKCPVTPSGPNPMNYQIIDLTAGKLVAKKAKKKDKATKAVNLAVMYGATTFDEAPAISSEGATVFGTAFDIAFGKAVAFGKAHAEEIYKGPNKKHLSSCCAFQGGVFSGHCCCHMSPIGFKDLLLGEYQKLSLSEFIYLYVGGWYVP